MRDPQRYTEIIGDHAFAAAALGVPGSFFPPADMVGMGVIWLQMFRNIADESGHEINGAFATKFIMSVTTSAALYVGGSKVATALLHLIPFAGNTTAAVTNAGFNYVYTERLGRFLVAQLNKPDVDFNSLFSAATAAIVMIFAFPTEDEVAMATASIHDHDVADVGDTVGVDHSTEVQVAYSSDVHSNLPVLEVQENTGHSLPVLEVQSTTEDSNLPTLAVQEELDSNGQVLLADASLPQVSEIQESNSSDNALFYGKTWAETYEERSKSYASNGNAGIGEYWHDAAEYAKRNKQ